MKNLMKYFGIIPALLLLTGLFFKVMHYPGAGILILVSIVLLIVVYCSLWLVNMHKKAEGSFAKLRVNFIYLFMLITGCAFLFKVMHWPGATVLMDVSAILALILIVVLWISASKQKGTEKEFLAYHTLILFIVACVFAFFPVFVGPGKASYEAQKYGFKSIDKAGVKLSEINHAIYQKNVALFTPDSVNPVNPIENHRAVATDLMGFIDNLSQTLIGTTINVTEDSFDTLALEHLAGGAVMQVDIPRMILMENGKGKELQEKLRNYENSITALAQQIGVNDFTFFMSEKIADEEWVQKCFDKKPILFVLLKLHNIKVGIYHTEAMLMLK